MEDSPIDMEMFKAVPVRDARQGLDPAVAALLALQRIRGVRDAALASFDRRRLSGPIRARWHRMR